MKNTSGMIFYFILFLSWGWPVFSAPKGKKTNISFDKALPEDISNENFPDRIDSFDFPDASLLDLVQAIGKLTGINFIIDPALQSKKISIIAPSPITVAEAYKAFLSALSANNYTVIKSGAFWKIQSTDKSHKDNTEVYGGDYFPNTDQLITRIIKLQYINAANFEKSIKLFLSKGHQTSIHSASNSIILSDYGSVIERVMKIVHEMDVPGSEEGVEIIPIEYASAEELSGILSELLSVKSNSRSSSRISRSLRKPRISLSASSRSDSSSGNIKISNIIPDLRTNSLVVSANKEGLKRVYELIKKLDTPVDASRKGGVYVYNVLYGTAEEVYNTLMGIKPSDSKEKRTRSSSSSFPSSYGRVSPSYGGKSSESPLFDNVRIMADSNTNSLIVSAKNKYDYDRVLAVLKKIDVPRDQVFIQAIIVEMIINKGDNREINLVGVLNNLFKESLNIPVFQDVLGSSVVGFLNKGFDATSLQKAKFGPGLVLGLPFLKLLNALNLSGAGTLQSDISNVLDSLQDRGLSETERSRLMESAINTYSRTSPSRGLETAFIPLIQLLKTASNVNVLSTPQLTTLDNVPAFIEVGENAPVGLTSTATVGALSQNSVEREDITLRLDIVPRINPESGIIQMDIKQKFDDFSNRNSTASELASRAVHIIKRNIETKMVLYDGETAVLGGLLTDKEITNENKIPVLGDIPVLGWFFKGSVVSKEKRNLLVFITPTIIKGEEQKEKSRQILGKKLEERIHFIKKNMKGRDPHGEALKRLIPESQVLSGKKSKEKNSEKSFKKWFWQKRNKDEDSSLNLKKKEEYNQLEEELDSPESVDLSEELLEDFSDEDFEDEKKEDLSLEDYKLAVPLDEDGEDAEGENKDEEKMENEEDDEGQGEDGEEAFISLEPEELGF